MSSKFQPIDLSQNCRVYFLFSPIGEQVFACYYDRPQEYSDQELYAEAALRTQTLTDLFGQEKPVRVLIARSQRQIDRIEATL